MEVDLKAIEQAFAERVLAQLHKQELITDDKEHLLVSKALPVFRPHTTSAPLATYHFCMRSIVPVLRLKFEAFRLSLLAFVSQVPVSIRLFLEIYRWPRGLSSLLRASARRYYFTVLNVDRNIASNAMLL